MRLLLFLLATGLLLASCQAPGASAPPPPSAEALAHTYCSSCHAFPDPGSLDRPTWRAHVLPRMGYMLGHYPDEQTRQSLLEAGAGGAKVEQMGVFPAQPVLSTQAWQAIQQYFLDRAPDSLPRRQRDLASPLPGFRPRLPAFKLSPPSTTLLQTGAQGDLWVGDAHSQLLYQLDDQFEVRAAAKTGQGAVSLHSRPDAYWVTVMGSFSPTDAPGGYLLALPRDGQGRPRKLISGLQRPVHTEVADLDGDHRDDLIICEFAKWTGRLAWWQQQEDGTFLPHSLRLRAGATAAYARDLDGDQRPEIIALFGQGDEGIFVYWNQGNGRFREEQVRQFPPSYGSSSLQLLDWNGDGQLDLLYTAGDNADYPPLYKPYHGLRLFLNQGGGAAFEEAFFLPLDGAYGAVAADFDQDGDLDLAAIAFFPDFEAQPEAGFVYFQNQGDDQFTPFTLPIASLGRWLIIRSGDVDQDGDLDLLLGSLAFEVIPPGTWVQQWQAQGIPFVVLENELR